MAIGEGKTTRLLEALEDGGSITGISGSGNTNLQNHIVDLIGDVDDAKQAIVEKGGTVGDTGLEGLASEIETISGGGGDVKPLDPVKVYEETRPADWLQMPATIENGDFYFLMHIAHGEPGDIEYKVHLWSSYAVGTPKAEFGKVVNGVFTPIPELTVDITGTNQTFTIPTSAYGDTTSDGFDQLIIKLSGWPNGYNDQAIAAQDTSVFREHAVEIMARADGKTSLNGVCATSTNSTSFTSLRYAYIDMPSATNLNYTFYNNYSLVSVRKFNVGKATTAQYMFSNCTNLKAIPLFDTSSVTNANAMFGSCAILPAIPEFDFSNNTTFTNMFSGCTSIKGIPKINTSKGELFNQMFMACSALESVPDLDTHSGYEFSSMFKSCTALKKAPMLDTSGGTAFGNMFYGCTALVEVPLYDTSKGQSFNGMFQNCSALQKVPDFDTSRGSYLNQMFQGCINLLYAPNIDTTSCTNFQNMFYGCRDLRRVPVYETSGATNFSGMFQSCTGLSFADLSNWDLKSATNTLNMFASCGSMEMILGDIFPAAGINGAFYSTANASNYALIRIDKTDAVLPLSANATNIFSGGSNQVYVPDDLLSAYQADSKWASLSTRLKAVSTWP